MSPDPPRPLVLGGWAATNDQEKLLRWENTVSWAVQNGCTEIISAIPEADFYYVKQVSTYEIGPMGGPMYLPWNWDPRKRPTNEEQSEYLQRLLAYWISIVGEDLAKVTCPLRFTGKKLRRLLVYVDTSHRPPWGDWASILSTEQERRAFTQFRQSINKAIAPHVVDHVDFRPIDEKRVLPAS